MNKYIYLICDQIGNRFQTTSGGWVTHPEQLQDGEYIKSFLSRAKCDEYIKHHKNTCSWGVNNRSEWWPFCDDGLGNLIN